MKHYISLGAGVQSSTMALMAAAGEITPMPEGAIFADTQAEPAPVYRWLDWLEQRLPFPVHRVTAGSLTKAALTRHTSKKGVSYCRTALPFHTATAEPRRGVEIVGGVAELVEQYGDEPPRVVKAGRITHRTCTRDYKIVPIMKAARRLAGVKRGEKTPVVCQWIGISTDEIMRVKPAREPWVASRWPLIEKRMSRAGCMAWLEANGHPEPPRSACVYCPFRSNREWRWLKKHDPEGFAAAVAFDEEARRIRWSTSMKSETFVHRSLKPLSEVDLRSDEERGQMLMWQDECEGMCGV